MLGFDKSLSDKQRGSEVFLLGVIGDYSYAIPECQSLEGLFLVIISGVFLLYSRREPEQK